MRAQSPIRMALGDQAISSFSHFKIEEYPFWSGGHYRAAIAADRMHGSAKAEAEAIASDQGQRADVTVNLDLRNLAPGTYYLATTQTETKLRISIC